MTWDPVWEQIFQSQPWGKYPTVELIRFVAKNFYQAKDRKSVRLLEIGCGPGANLWYLAREGFTVYGIDGSATAIRIAKDRLDRECNGWQGELRTADITQLPYPDGFFDAVVDVEAIYCNDLENSKRIYRELFRVTKPQGKLISITFAAKSWGDGVGAKVSHNTWVVSEGPLSGKGMGRFTDQNDIPDLIGGFMLENLEMVTRTVNGLKNEIREWIIEGVKTVK